MRGREVAIILNDLEHVAAVIRKEPLVLVHRDMQSSNVLIHRGKPVFIDFQSMRLGPAVYDIASLLCDPYVMLPINHQLRLLACYAARFSGARDVQPAFWHAAIERLEQALGAYARLAAAPGTGRFASYVAPALTMMKRALSFVDGLHGLRSFVEKNQREPSV